MSPERLAELKEKILEMNPKALLMQGFDQAIVGVVERCGQPTLVAYDRERCIGILMKQDRVTYEAAMEYFDANCAGAWLGEHTPVILTAVKNL